MKLHYTVTQTLINHCSSATISRHIETAQAIDSLIDEQGLPIIGELLCASISPAPGLMIYDQAQSGYMARECWLLQGMAWNYTDCVLAVEPAGYTIYPYAVNSRQQHNLIVLCSTKYNISVKPSAKSVFAPYRNISKVITRMADDLALKAVRK